MLRVEELVRDYPVHGSADVVHAVSDVSFSVERGETLGIVGESGCGKSTTARLVALLEEPTSGRILLDDREVTGLKGKQVRALRRRIQMVFQDPYSSLNPRVRIGDALAEVLRVHKLAGRNDRHAQVTQLLEMVGLRESHASRFHTSSPAGNASASSLRAPSPSSPRCSCWTRPFRRWTSQCEPRS